MTYPLNSDGLDREPLNPSPRFPDVEQSILKFWAQDDTFQASVDQREGAPEWVFYDGPPFANGLPHYGHLVASTLKDTVPAGSTSRTTTKLLT